MRPQQTKTTRYYTIPLRSPIPGAPPRYVAIPIHANDQQRARVPSTSTGTAVAASATSSASKTQTQKLTKPKTQTSPTKIAVAPNKPKPKPKIMQRRARSVPLQEMREAVIDIRDNARRGDDHHHRRDDDSTTKTTSDMPADDVHFLKYWET